MRGSAGGGSTNVGTQCVYLQRFSRRVLAISLLRVTTKALSSDNCLRVAIHRPKERCFPIWGVLRPLTLCSTTKMLRITNPATTSPKAVAADT